MDTDIQITKNNRDLSLDFLKVIATVAVVKLHSGYDGFIGSTIQYLCGFAVPLFFMVSGALALNKKNIGGGYYLKKGFKIISLMLYWLVPLYILTALKNRSLINPIEFFVGPMFQKGRMAVCWFLWALFFLYLLSSVLKKLFASEKSRKITTNILLLLMLAVFSFNFYLATHGMNIFDSYIPQCMRLWSHITYYWLGAVLYERMRLNKIDADNSKTEVYDLNVCLKGFLIGFLTFCVSAAMLQYGTAVLIMGIDSPEYMFECPVVILLNTFIFVFALSMNQRNGFIIKIASFIKYSLGVYLIHPFVKSAIFKVGIWEISWVLNWVIMLVVSLMISVIIYRIPYLNKMIRL